MEQMGKAEGSVDPRERPDLKGGLYSPSYKIGDGEHMLDLFGFRSQIQ